MLPFDEIFFGVEKILSNGEVDLHNRFCQEQKKSVKYVTKTRENTHLYAMLWTSLVDNIDYNHG